MKEIILGFIKEKFELLLVAGLFTLVFLCYMTINPEAGPEMAGRANSLRELWQGLLYAFLALLGVRPRAGSPADRAAVGSATTETGDIVVTKDGPAGSGKDKTK